MASMYADVRSMFNKFKKKDDKAKDVHKAGPRVWACNTVDCAIASAVQSAWFQRLRLKYDKLRSISAFNFRVQFTLSISAFDFRFRFPHSISASFFALNLLPPVLPLQQGGGGVFDAEPAEHV